VSRTLAVAVGSDRVLGLVFWVAVIAAAGLLEAAAHLTAHLTQRRRVPRAGDLIARYLGTPALRAVAIAAWLYAGWHLFSH
jgi:hypothetical protein